MQSAVASLGEIAARDQSQYCCVASGICIRVSLGVERRRDDCHESNVATFLTAFILRYTVNADLVFTDQIGYLPWGTLTVIVFVVENSLKPSIPLNLP